MEAEQNLDKKNPEALLQIHYYELEDDYAFTRFFEVRHDPSESVEPLTFSKFAFDPISDFAISQVLFLFGLLLANFLSA